MVLFIFYLMQPSKFFPDKHGWCIPLLLQILHPDESGMIIMTHVTLGLFLAISCSSCVKLQRTWGGSPPYREVMSLTSQSHTKVYFLMWLIHCLSYLFFLGLCMIVLTCILHFHSLFKNDTTNVVSVNAVTVDLTYAFKSGGRCDLLIMQLIFI